MSGDSEVARRRKRGYLPTYLATYVVNERENERENERTMARRVKERGWKKRKHEEGLNSITKVTGWGSSSSPPIHLERRSFGSLGVSPIAFLTSSSQHPLRFAFIATSSPLLLHLLLHLRLLPRLLLRLLLVFLHCFNMQDATGRQYEREMASF